MFAKRKNKIIKNDKFKEIERMTNYHLNAQNANKTKKKEKQPLTSNKVKEFIFK